MKIFKFYITFFFLLHSLLLSAANYSFSPTAGMSFSWTKGEIVGLYTEKGTFIRTNIQSLTSDSHYAVLSGNGWTLAENSLYYAYAPYNEYNEIFEIAPSNLGVNYALQKQLNNGDASHLAKYDYLMSSFTTTISADISFDHIGSVIRVEWNMPEDKILESLSLSTPSKVFVLEGSMNLPEQTFTHKTMADSITLSLDRIKVDGDNPLVAYIMVAPTDLSDKTVKATLKASDGTEYKASLLGTKITAGNVYPIVIGDTQPSQTKSLSKAVTPSDSHITSIAEFSAYAPDFPIDSDNMFSIAPTFLKGDVNHDGTVDVVDAVALNGYYLTGKTSTLDPAVCDMNDDGTIDVVDVIAIISKYLTGK